MTNASPISAPSNPDANTHGGFEEDHLTRYSLQQPVNIESNPRDWTLKELVCVCLLSQAQRPPLLKDPRAAYLSLAKKIERQLWIELEMQQTAFRESRTFHRNRFVVQACSNLEYEIRSEHGQLQPHQFEMLKSVFDPLKSAISEMRNFKGSPAPLPGDKKIEGVQNAHDKSEDDLGKLVDSTIDPAMAEFEKYAIHCQRVSMVSQAQSVPLRDNPPPPDEFAKLRQFVCDELKGYQRKVVEEICNAGGRLSLANIKSLFKWQAPIDGCWNSLRGKVNKRLESQGFHISTKDHVALLKQIPVTARK